MKRKKRKTYSKQFKLDTVKLVLEEKLSCSEVGRNLGIGSGIVQRWVHPVRKKLLPETAK